VTTFDSAFAWLLTDEGADFVNDPADNGGATRMGVTQADLSEWWGRPASIEDVMALTPDMARAYYLAQYWQPLQCDAITSPIKATAFFDIAVLTGRRVGVVLAQAAAQAKPDGNLGPKTLMAINATSETHFITHLAAEAASRFVNISIADPTQTKFLRAWVSRALRLMELLPL